MTGAMNLTNIRTFTKLINRTTCYAFVICSDVIDRNNEAKFTTNIASRTLIDECLLLSKHNGHGF